MEKECNAFSKALADARKNGDKTFVVSGKTYNCEDFDEAYGGTVGMASYDPTLSKKKKDEKDEEKGLTKKEKNDTMTDTGKKITPVEISPKMAKIKNEKRG